MEHQEKSGNHQPATWADQGAATTADGPAPGEGTEAGEDISGGGASIPRCEALPQVDVAWINGNWAPLLTGRWESGPGSNSGVEVREAIPEEQDRPGLSLPHSTNHLHF